MFLLQITGTLTSFFILLIIFELIRRKKIKEKYALVWIALFVSFIAICLYFPIVVWVSDLLGIQTPSNTLFFLGMIFSLLIILSLTVIVSILSNRIRLLAQKLALLEFELNQLKEK